MRRCTSCFHYSRGHPAYCPRCGRTYSVRLCPRGHINGRSAQYCTDCGSDDLSTPAAPETWLSRVSHWILMGFVIVTVVITLFAFIASVFVSIDWSQVAPRLVAMVLMIGLLQWLMTLLPGPVQKIGKAAAKTGMKFFRNQAGRGRGHR